MKARRLPIPRILLVLAAFTLVAVVAAILAGRIDGASQWVAPPAAAEKQNPLKNRPELASGGEKIFSRTCASCHEPGPYRKGPDLSDRAVQQETDGTLFWKISNGNSRSGMPGYGALPEAQRWQLVLYIRALAANTGE
jgi:mono/diheme cytochrome c family protein